MAKQLVKQKVRKVNEQISTISDLRGELLGVFTDLQNGTIELKEAAELNNTAGKIINSVKVELEYYTLVKKAPTTKFITG